MIETSFSRFNLGFFRVASAVPEVMVGNPDANADNIIELARKATEMSASLIVFPELSVTGYTCADLFNQKLLIDGAERAVEKICEWSLGKEITLIVGAPIRVGNSLFNCAVVICNGRIYGAVPKCHLPNYNEFYEKRWFRSGFDLASKTIIYAGHSFVISKDILFDIAGTIVGAEICEDLWVPVPPSCRQAAHGATVIANLSATDETIGKHSYLLSLIKQQSARCRAAYVYASAGIGESSTDLVFSGNAIIAEDGSILEEGKRFEINPQLLVADIDIEKLILDRTKFNSFSDNYDKNDAGFEIIIIDTEFSSYSNGLTNQTANTLLRKVDPTPFIPSDNNHLREACEEITDIQVWGLMQRLRATGCKNVVIGISGGLDSTLALLVAVRTFDKLNLDRKGICAITMPGFGTTGRTHGNAEKLMEYLGVEAMEININDAVSKHFADIDHNPEIKDATYENSQARERTQILMDMANKKRGMVIGTGDLSESALGWCTYNGDQMSMYGVNASVPKTLVRYLVSYHASQSPKEVAEVLNDIIDTPISPELIPANEDGTIAQKTEDLVGPYELHDFFIFHTLRNGFRPSKIFMLAKVAFGDSYDASTIKKWLVSFYSRFFSQQFKRSCTPDAPKVGSVNLSPRGDWRMPSDASSAMWLNEAKNIEI